jgi:hypothetical protein
MTKQKSNHISQDAINTAIITFCTKLFGSWLEDYEWYVELIKERSLGSMGTYVGRSYHLNQGMKKNLADWCLPLDYFVERMLQIGLCRNMRSMKEILELVCEFDDIGYQATGPNGKA